MPGGGVITIQKAMGDVYFVKEDGSEAMDPIFNVKVDVEEEFGGLTIEDAVEDAKRFTIGALKNKMQQKISGRDCQIVVKDVDVDYKIKYGFGA